MLDRLWFRFLASTDRLYREERGDGLVNWVVLAVGLAAAAAGLVVLLRPAIQQTGQRIVDILTGG
jgi:hypothetical protein